MADGEGMGVVMAWKTPGLSVAQQQSPSVESLLADGPQKVFYIATQLIVHGYAS